MPLYCDHESLARALDSLDEAIFDLRGHNPAAESEDGLIEGVESPRHRFMIAIQWHPERMQEDHRQQNLFRALVSEAR
jgi:gamma-glutamyl-gamma-aminobutyrate hydrolase PuuD